MVTPPRPRTTGFVIPEGAHWSDVRTAPRECRSGATFRLPRHRGREPGNACQGVFGNAPWTDKEQMPDETLKDLIEHFSKQALTLAAVPEDELGNGYEYLIKKFADDSGHTAQEFYTNRTLVHLMAQMLEPQPGEMHLRPDLRDRRDAHLLPGGGEAPRGRDAHHGSLRAGDHQYHGGDRKDEPRHPWGVRLPDLERQAPFRRTGLCRGRTRLRTFDVVLANPPYSIKKWNRDAWEKDPWGRNFLGTPSQGRADYAFFQHILKSMDLATGRCAILFPHGVLFRNEEAEMRRRAAGDGSGGVRASDSGRGSSTILRWKLASSSAEAGRQPARQGRILFIDAVAEIAREKAQSFLLPEHQKRESSQRIRPSRMIRALQRCSQNCRCAERPRGTFPSSRYVTKRKQQTVHQRRRRDACVRCFGRHSVQRAANFWTAMDGLIDHARRTRTDGENSECLNRVNSKQGWLDSRCVRRRCSSRSLIAVQRPWKSDGLNRGTLAGEHLDT